MEYIKNSKSVIVMIIACFILGYTIGLTLIYSVQCKELSNITAELEEVNQNYISEFKRANELAVAVNDLKDELIDAKSTIYVLKNTQYRLVYMGDFKLTHYCTEEVEHICGTGDGVTSTGTSVTSGRTVAVDNSVIPYGAKIYIEGYGWRTAEDSGGSVEGTHIDIAVGTHEEALSLGTNSGGVWLLIEE